MVALIVKTNTWKAEAGRLLIDLFEASLVYKVPGQPGLHRETLSQEKKKKKKKAGVGSACIRQPTFRCAVCNHDSHQTRAAALSLHGTSLAIRS